MLGISGSPAERASMRLVTKRKRSLSPDYSASASAGEAHMTFNFMVHITDFKAGSCKYAAE